MRRSSDPFHVIRLSDRGSSGIEVRIEGGTQLKKN